MKAKKKPVQTISLEDMVKELGLDLDDVLKPKNEVVEVYEPPPRKEGEMVEAKEGAETARAALEAVSARVIREVDRFRLVVDTKLRHIVSEMGGIAVRFDDKINDAWGTILANTQPSVEPKFDAV